MASAAPALETETEIIKIMVITPAIAREWLEKNTRNRPVKKTVKAVYVRDMLSGSWQFAGDPIRFDTEDNLLDGQHRLHSLIEAGETNPDVSIRNVVIWNLDPAAKTVMDTGARRSAGDALNMLGIRNADIVAASIRIILLHEKGQMVGTGDRVTNSEVQNWLFTSDEHAAEYEDWVSAHHQQARYFPAPPGTFLGGCYPLFQIDPVEAQEFYDGLTRGENLPSGDPRLRLTKRLIDMRFNKERITRPDYVGFLYTAWNLYRNQQSMQRLQRPRGGWTNENFPVPQ